MELSIGQTISDKLSEILRASLTGKDMTKVAADNDASINILIALVSQKRNITANNKPLIIAAMKKAFHVNKIEIKKRASYNRELAEQSRLLDKEAA